MITCPYLLHALSPLHAAAFLKNMGVETEAPQAEPAATPAQPSSNLKAKPAKGRAGLKHIGGYFDRETVEQVAILRARLDLDNSQLIKKAVEELFQREMAARKFGDR